ncbi:MAG TPA: HAD hydrolase-like protein [Pyrinomonadaceae bacterium]
MSALSPHHPLPPSPRLPLSPSPRLPLTPSPHHPITPSPTLPITPSPTHSIASSDLRILLWDIDGTLIRSLKTGGYKIYTIPVLEEIFGTSGQLATMRVSGMTDLQIIAEALREEGFTHEDIRKQIHQVSERLTAEARRVTGNGEPFFELLPGVTNTLHVLDEHPRYQSALLTGNIEPMAWLKMELVGLDQYFKLPGAFGEESHQRRDLPERAAARINNYLQQQLAPEQFVVIGDTPNDIDCARHFGARAVAVGTGRFYSMEEMLACKPDAWLEDLSDAELVVNTLDKL